MPICHRLFFAALPSATERALTGLQRDRLDDILTPVANDRLHMTLGITNDYARFPEEVADRMLAIGAEVSADPFHMKLDRLSAGARSVALRPSRRAPALHEAQRQLHHGMTYWSILRDEWSFNPHVTLGYRDGDHFLMPIAPVEWDVREIVLVHSLVGDTRHAVLGRWRLQANQQSFAGF